jgi:Xaa-Pro aminopeptidase
VSAADRRTRALRVLREHGADVLVARDPATVLWLTGVAVDIETGPSPFGQSPVAVLGRDGGAHLVISSDDAPEVDPDGVEVLTYTGFTTGSLDGQAAAQALVGELVRDRGTIALDSPAQRSPAEGVAQAELSRPLLRERAVKDPDEIAAIRRAIAICDIGQRALRQGLHVGVDELRLHGAVRTAMEEAAGSRLPLLSDLVGGERAAGMGGPPSRRVVADGEAVLCDLAPRVDGVWGDSCSTVACGEPSAELRVDHRRVVDVLQRLIEAVAPGVTAGDLDALARRHLTFGHHTGHGIGGSYHEEPRIVPGAEAVLEPGMVLALEPGLYGAGHGVRLEHVVLVTEDGCEVLSRHAVDLEPGGGLDSA